MIADMFSNKKLDSIVTEFLSDVENETFFLFLLRILILLYQKILE